MFNLDTLVDVFARLAASDRERAFLWKDSQGSWHPISTRQIAARVYGLATAFERWGVVKGDRIAILSENRWEWPVVDFATLVLGAVDVPIYPTLTAAQTASLLADAEARIAVVSSAQQYAKIASIRGQTALERLVVMDEMPAGELSSARGEAAFSSLTGDRAPSADLEAWVRSFPVRPADLATIIYTSGTTGESKGVMLTHGAIASNLNHSTAAFDWLTGDSFLSFLPLSHITARHVDYALMCYGATLAYCPRFEDLPAALAAIRPTIFIAVPRVYEKIRERAEQMAAQSPARKIIFSWALAVGRRRRAWILTGRRPGGLRGRVADRLVLRRIRQAFGGRVRDFLSGGAPLGIETAGWFADAGIRIFEGYGLTETSPVLALNNPRDHRIGSVGKPIPSVEHRLAGDGELLVRGPFLFSGYWRKAEATAQAIDGDGWFHTGDLARLDEDGFLYITGRKKNLIKTSGGKLIAPEPIESSLMALPLIGQAAVVGDRRNFLTVLIAPNFAALEHWARERGIPFASRADLLKDRRVLAQYEALLETVNRNLAKFETIKSFHLVPDEWSIESGELTPSMKLKRGVVLERYGKEIAALYSAADSPFPSQRI